MPSTPLLLLLVLVAAIAGAALGLMLGARRATAAGRAAAEGWREKFNRAITDLAVAATQAAQAEALRGEVAGLRDAEAAARAALSAAAAQAEERARAHEAQLVQLRDAKEALSAQFGEVGGRLLADAQKAFLDRADQRFAQAGEKTDAQLKALLTPVETTLKRYEEGLARVEKDRVGSYAALDAAVAQLAQGNEVVRRETQRLANVMRSSPKARGRWGEEQLRTILEAAGLAENVDFSLQSTVADGEKQLRPDCVIHLPGGRCIVIDVKCPLVAFEQAFDEEDEDRRAALLLQHAGAMRSYAGDLGRKGYWRQFDLSPDFVIMFIPGEHFLSAAAERAPDLIEQAFRAGVIIASTINMLALAKVMAGLWRQESLEKRAQEVADEGRKLYSALRKVTEHVSDLGKGLNRAVSAYGGMIGSLEGGVLTHSKRLADLKVDTGGKSLEPLVAVEQAIRPIVKLNSLEDQTEAAE